MNTLWILNIDPCPVPKNSAGKIGKHHLPPPPLERTVTRPHFIQLLKRNQNSFCISITLYIVNLIWFLASQVCWGVAINWSDQASCWSLCCEGGESAREGWEERSRKWSILFLEWTSKSVLKVQCCVCPTHNPPNFRCRRRLRDERSRALSFIRKLLLCVGEALLT